MDEVEIFEAFDTDISEMTTDAVGGLVPLSPELVAEITEGDDDPRFATFVIESGWSKSKRYWGPELFGEVVSEISDAAQNEPIVGYLGHIKPEDDPYTFPEIQLQWAGAKLLQAGEKAKLAVKAYVLPGTKGRQYLGKKRPLVKTVSWRGKAALEPFQKGVRVAKFHIESIDLSRPRAAGMSAKLVGALTSEMEERSNEVKPEEIAALQANELRAHNPSLVESIETEARKPLETKVGEMEDEKKKADPVLGLIPKLRSALGLKDEADEITVLDAAISKIQSEAKSLRTSILDKVLEKRLKGGSDADRALVRRVLVGEMESRDVKLTGNSDEDEKAVSEMVTQIIDGDESLKTTVSEMEDAPAAPPTTQRDSGTSPEWKPGMSTSNVRVKARV
jgi:hypothetical protein